ncbi:MAG: HPr family phosphocarrier protein [Oscillospiraceae bacterium]|nr:HPr family phosphocarrier protein [Oscillospiraceae bacterium]
MISFDFTVNDKDGLHARPAGQLVKEAQKLDSVVTIRKGEKAADLRKLFAVMSLGVKQGETITVEVEGGAEEANAEFVKQFLSDNF